MPTDSPSSSSAEPFAETHKALSALSEKVSSEHTLGLDLVDVKALIDRKGADLHEILRQEYFKMRRNDEDIGG